MRYKRPRLGQHFLKSQAIARRIVLALPIKATDTVVEIGPGRGILTRELLKKNARIIAVEIENRLADNLRESLPSRRLTVQNCDFLKFDLTQYSKVKIIGNIPYWISQPLIEKLVDNQDNWHLAILTFQREFALRLLSKPKRKTYGSLSVFFQYHLKGERLFDIPARFFTPEPKVISTVIRMKPRQRKVDRGFERFTKMLFSKRRKMLRSILKGREIPDYYRTKRPAEISIIGLLKLYKYCQR